MGRTVYLPTWMVDFYGFHVGIYIYIYRSHGSYGILWIATENIAGKWTCPRCLASIPSLTKTNSSHLIMDGSFQIFQRRQHEYWAPKKVGFLEGKSPYFRENPGYTSIIVCRSYCVLSSPGHTWKSWESQRPSGAFKVGRLVQYGSIWPRWLEDVLLFLLSKVVWTHLWNTSQATFTNRPFQAIFFHRRLGGIAPGLCSRGCAVTFFDFGIRLRTRLRSQLLAPEFGNSQIHPWHQALFSRANKMMVVSGRFFQLFTRVATPKRTLTSKVYVILKPLKPWLSACCWCWFLFNNYLLCKPKRESWNGLSMIEVFL